MPESHDLSSSYPTPLSYGWASHTPTNPWSLCEAHRCRSSNSCAERSLRCCLKANPNPSDTAVSCHFSHEFRNSFWYGGLLRIATEQSTYLLWSSCHCLSLSSVVCFRHLSLLQDGPAPLTHSICCFHNISLHRKFPIRQIKKASAKTAHWKIFSAFPIRSFSVPSHIPLQRMIGCMRLLGCPLTANSSPQNSKQGQIQIFSAHPSFGLLTLCLLYLLSKTCQQSLFLILHPIEHDICQEQTFPQSTYFPTSSQ